MIGSLLLAAALLASPADAQTRRFVIEEEVITGKIRKPEVTLFIARQNLDTDYKLELRKSFVPRVVKSVQKKPF
ncbi:MAG: hypothetical protein D6798_03920 [Deltaproteobacteria bacterium]|nr:MAG: hypothetical protein D6798_03920 [Deltaproteobacteria bacterium]